jgi:hypothetical protein
MLKARSWSSTLLATQRREGDAAAGEVSFERLKNLPQICGNYRFYF